jgi:hypothetical protein
MYRAEGPAFGWVEFPETTRKFRPTADERCVASPCIEGPAPHG